MSRTKICATALVLFLVWTFATPAFANPAGEQQKRDAARAKKAKLAAELNVLKADDQQLESAVRAIDAGVFVQAKTTDSAQQAVRAANVAVGAAGSRLAVTEQKMDELRSRTSALAVRAYVHPGGDALLEIVRSHDLGEASRKQALMAHVVSADRDVLEQTRALRQDISSDRSNLSEARQLAQERTQAAKAKLVSLQQVQVDQRRLKSALDERIQDYVNEVDALSKEEGRLSALIRSRQATETDTGGGGGGGGAVSGSGLIWPASGPLTSGFGMRWGRLHAGIDIAAGYGAPVRAAKGGTVILAGYNGGYGNAVIIDHGGGFSTLYAHMSRLTTSDGAVVRQGQQVGAVGSTGHSTGAHLHFETRIGGTAQNPRRYLP